MTAEQLEIKKIIDDYKRDFADEFQQFKGAQRIKKDLLKNKFAEIKGNNLIVRQILEYPENLYVLLKINLSLEAFNYMQSIKGSNWIAKNFKELSIPEKI